jgi:hypothetical protein
MRPDHRPEIILYWIMDVVALGVGILMVVLLFTATISSDPTPIVVIMVIGLLGAVAVPFLIRATIREFRGRGLRGMFQAIKNTPWGDGN